MADPSNRTPLLTCVRGSPNALRSWCYTKLQGKFAPDRPNILQLVNSLFPEDLSLQSYKEICLPYLYLPIFN